MGAFKGNLMKNRRMRRLVAGAVLAALSGTAAGAQSRSHVAPGENGTGSRSPEYDAVQKQLARGWNTWDVHSVATQVLLPDGLAIHVGMKHNTGEFGDAFLGDALIGSFGPDVPIVTPGPHSWDGSYTRADFEWKGHKWRVESAHDGNDLVMLVTPLEAKRALALPPTVVFSVNYLWNRPGTTLKHGNVIEAATGGKTIPVYCACPPSDDMNHYRTNLPVG